MNVLPSVARWQRIRREARGGEGGPGPIRLSTGLFAGLVLPLLLASGGAGIAQTIDTNLWVTDHPVYAIVRDGGTIYTGGVFTQVHPHPTQVNPTGAGGQPRNRIAALDAATGTATAWNPNANGGVYALAVSGNTVYVGGDFTEIGGQARKGIAALDATTGAATAWNPDADGTVYSLAVSGGTVYVAGSFTRMGGQARNNIAALDATTGAATAWDPNAQNSSTIYVQALALSGGTVYAGGEFNSIGGQPRNNIAALDMATGAATAWDPNANSTILTLAVGEGTVYVGGSFDFIGGQTRGRIAALDSVTGAATAWNPLANDNVFTLAVDGGTVYAGGWFDGIGGQRRSLIAALDAATGAATDWDPNAMYGVIPHRYGTVGALAVSAGTVYAGGDFTIIGGETQPNFASITADARTATLLVQFEAATTAEGIELRWSFGDASPITTVTLERSLDNVGPWLSIAPESHDESGVTVAMDLSAGDSREYFYRLVVHTTDGGQMVFGPVSASYRESSLKSDLAPLLPNPSSGRGQAQYSVARAGRVRLELLDISGRVMETLSDRIQGQGRYTLMWDSAGPHGRLLPGLYLVRLLAPDLMTTRKVALIR